MNDSVAFGIIMMVIGAVFGSIIAPISEAMSRKIIEGRHKSVGLHTALLFLMSANAIWIVAEVTSFIATIGVGGILTELSLAVIFLFSAFVLFGAYKHIPETEEKNEGLLLVSFKFLILGNLAWIIAEFSEMAIGGIAELLEVEIGRFNLYVRIGISSISIFLFLMGIVRIWKIVPKKE